MLLCDRSVDEKVVDGMGFKQGKQIGLLGTDDDLCLVLIACFVKVTVAQKLLEKAWLLVVFLCQFRDQYGAVSAGVHIGVGVPDLDTFAQKDLRPVLFVYLVCEF